jgi:hypothetical protein
MLAADHNRVVHANRAPMIHAKICFILKAPLPLNLREGRSSANLRIQHSKHASVILCTRLRFQVSLGEKQRAVTNSGSLTSWGYEGIVRGFPRTIQIPELLVRV